MKRVPDFVLRLLLVVAVLTVWEGAVRLFSIPAFILPAPSSIALALWRGIESTLYLDHIRITVVETLLGFVFGSILALVLGTMIALSRRAEYFLYPFIVMFQSMPKVALAPLIIVWFGLGLTSKVAQAAVTAFFPLMVNTIAGLRSADEDRVALMQSLDASNMQILTMLRLPSALPFIMAGFEIAMVLSLIGAIVILKGGDKSRQEMGHTFLGLFALTIVFGVIIGVLSRLLTPTRIDKQFGCFKGACVDFLATLPTIQ